MCIDRVHILAFFARHFYRLAAAVCAAVFVVIFALSQHCLAASNAEQAEAWDWPEWEWPYEGDQLKTDMPPELVRAATSQKLADLSMRCPFIFKAAGASSTGDFSGAVDMLKEKTAVFRALMDREDAYSALVEYYCNKEPDRSAFDNLTPKERRRRSMEIMIKSGEYGFQFIENMFLEFTTVDGRLTPVPTSALAGDDEERFMEKLKERRYMLFSPTSLDDPRLEPLRLAGDARFLQAGSRYI